MDKQQRVALSVARYRKYLEENPPIVSYNHWVHDDEMRRVYDRTKSQDDWETVTTLCGLSVKFRRHNRLHGMCPECDDLLRGE